MATAISTNAAIKQELFKRINLKAGGNSTRGLKEVSSDLVNSMGLKDSEIADMTGLSSSTISRMKSLEPAESGEAYRPQTETVERILKGCNYEVTLTPVRGGVAKRYMNKPKD